MAERRSNTFTYHAYDSIDELSPEDGELLKEAEVALKDAYAPYSRFKVGAALLLENGTIHKGNNQENAAYPSGICAERVALFHAISSNPGAIVSAIAIAAEAQDFDLTRIITPCGSCRQVMLEYEVNSASPMKIIMGSCKGQIIVVDSVLSLLPLSFCETRLKK
jgi:cytidine deaminase